MSKKTTQGRGVSMTASIATFQARFDKLIDTAPFNNGHDTHLSAMLSTNVDLDGNLKNTSALRYSTSYTS
jgi:hypothetical protein